MDKYTWVAAGSSYLPSELNAACLWAQLLKAEDILNNRMACWCRYYEELAELAEAGYIELPHIPEGCRHNAHIFYIKAKNLEERTNLISYMKKNDVMAVFHYVPLHTAPAGLKYGEFRGEDRYTTSESERLVRLPLYYGLSAPDQAKVIELIKKFYKGK